MPPRLKSLRRHQSAKRIDKKFIKRALEIPVSKKFMAKAKAAVTDDSSLIIPEPRTWLLGMFNLDDDQFPSEKAAIARGTRRAAKVLDLEEDDVDWIRYPPSWRIAQEAREGDNIIQVWRGSRTDKRPQYVYRATPIALRQEEDTCVRFFLRPQGNRVSWSAFRKQWAILGYVAAPGLNAERLLPSTVANVLDALWD